MPCNLIKIWIQVLYVILATYISYIDLFFDTWTIGILQSEKTLILKQFFLSGRWQDVMALVIIIVKALYLCWLKQHYLILYYSRHPLHQIVHVWTWTQTLQLLSKACLNRLPRPVCHPFFQHMSWIVVVNKHSTSAPPELLINTSERLLASDHSLISLWCSFPFRLRLTENQALTPVSILNSSKQEDLRSTNQQT